MKPSWSLTFDVTWSIFWRFIVFYLSTGFGIGIVASAVLGLYGAHDRARTVGQIVGIVIFFPALMLAVRGALADSFCFLEEPNQPPQHNAGNRPSLGDSPASATPSSLGPRG